MQHTAEHEGTGYTVCRDGSAKVGTRHLTELNGNPGVSFNTLEVLNEDEASASRPVEWMGGRCGYLDREGDVLKFYSIEGELVPPVGIGMEGEYTGVEGFIRTAIERNMCW